MKFLGINVTCTLATALQKISTPYFERHTVLVDQKPILLICQLSPAAPAKSLKLCPTLCDPIDGSPPGSLVPGILQARTLDWVATSFSNAWKWKVKWKSLNRVRPGSTVHGIFHARVLEWGAIAFSATLPKVTYKVSWYQLKFQQAFLVEINSWVENSS